MTNTIADRLGIIAHAEMQEDRNGNPTWYVWTDKLTGGTFYTTTADLANVEANLWKTRAAFGVKPGMFADWKECAACGVILAVSSAIVVWMFWTVVS